MSEAHRYQVVKMLSEAGNRISYDPHGPEVVMAEAYDQLKAENQDLRMQVKELDLTFGRYLLGMRASVVEWQEGKGADAAMQWIYNGLAGPGELPPAEETQAQAYFDREVVKIEEGLEEVYAYRDKRRAEKTQNTKEAQ
ncbi:hypothetical protein [Pseudomonas mosselii]|uniref:hypothetical protein n=1 Tax=Pseudomonas mosselii TaxID=78327 RepID=UPI002022DB2A|nr:hypothetical protein [Pseudomonas mosselii]MCL8299407.1 hypothetical protein [Pseudomonas mosselii]MCL8339737.1 hypothetical protein [Pseudomonas mosselii]